jgi:uncharacterized LabA/DUF88 family protein
MNGNKKIAVLIDGDNAESSIIEQILTETGNNGRVTIKRIYADWTENRMNKWKAQLNKHAIRPMQKFAYTNGKNSTDTALIIDAMDILHANLVDGFCIVSSDSDYTGLAHRIREQGLFVMGIGNGRTPEAFVKSCESFTYTEILHPQENKKEEKQIEEPENSETFKVNAPILPGPKVIGKIELPLIGSLTKSSAKSINQGEIDAAFNMVVDVNTGLALLSRFSEALRRVNSTFDHRNYACSSFRSFCEKLQPNYITYIHADSQTISLKRQV